MDTVLAALIGIALSATCGFRIFVPLLAVCLATRAEGEDAQPLVELADNFNWLASDSALIVFLVAAIFEIVGYYLPVIDNFLDTVATPASVLAGTLITAAFLTGMEPWMQWVLGLIAGGGMAGAVQSTTVVARAASTVTTGGLGNPIVASVETGYSFLGSFLAVLAAPVALVILLFLVFLGLFMWNRRRRLGEVKARK
ncbi:MAG: hypothetical protein CMO70_03650 [Verrucomicrobiales bacterium]|jgi:hypothetical protein|nr:hypothetical protein [Verrucomicrobiales bacterium]|tara:strand:- start:1201 stop:1794 length:594 start_codon:yes stop_codon:yes gene_type:complete